MDYQALTPELVQELSAIAPGRVFTGSDINEDYSHDEMPIYGKSVPEAVVEAASTEEIAAVMKFCNEHHIPVTPRGAGTGLVGGAVPIRGGVLLVTTRMNKILGYDEENFTVTVQPGVLLNTLAEDAASKGLLYPPDPGEKFATLGGNVSTNAGGMRAVKYGCTRDYVKAMTVVLPTGEIIHLGSSVSKTSSGYSLLNLMIDLVEILQVAMIFIEHFQQIFASDVSVRPWHKTGIPMLAHDIGVDVACRYAQIFAH